MSEHAYARQERILHWLAESQRLSIDDLSARLGVSAMTVHRDLDALAQRGLAQKVHGGVVAAEPKPSRAGTPACDLCGMAVSPRTAFILQLRTGESRHACCPHCGFLLLGEAEAPLSLLTKDFLYGRTLNANQGFYLLESAVAPCCVPSVLCFASFDDADRFLKGFDGWIADFVTARQYLSAQHSTFPG